MELRRINDEEDARACLRAVGISGMARAVWARTHGVNPRSLNAWRIALERRGPRESAAGLRLVELVAAAPVVTAYRVRVGRFEVDVEPGYDDGALVRLLRVLASC